MRDLAASRVSNVNAGVVEEQSLGTVYFDFRLFLFRFRRFVIRIAGCLRSGILQDRGCRGQSDFQFLLIGVQGLARQIDGGLGGLH